MINKTDRLRVAKEERAPISWGKRCERQSHATRTKQKAQINKKVAEGSHHDTPKRFPPRKSKKCGPKP